MITLLDYGAGNVRSLVNALKSLGETVRFVQKPDDILSAEKLIFPGVGAFGSMMRVLYEKGYVRPLKSYLDSNRPFLGICIGLQALFERSEEEEFGVHGLGFIRGSVRRFAVNLSVPHIGWNGLSIKKPSRIFSGLTGKEKFYFVHSYHVVPEDHDGGSEHDRLWIPVRQQYSKRECHCHAISSGKKRERRAEDFGKFSGSRPG